MQLEEVPCCFLFLMRVFIPQVQTFQHFYFVNLKMLTKPVWTDNLSHGATSVFARGAFTVCPFQIHTVHGTGLNEALHVLKSIADC